mmetsp:Transcript_11409/g.25049  ORF Transcript_11409/g.25049 Transcript_11409/m.25049 type:complete len:96 (+) Transcript_11409:49-336(+)
MLRQRRLSVLRGQIHVSRFFGSGEKDSHHYGKECSCEYEAGLLLIVVDKSPIIDGNADVDTDAADRIAPLSPASSDAPSPPPAKLKSFNSNNLIK